MIPHTWSLVGCSPKYNWQISAKQDNFKQQSVSNFTKERISICHTKWIYSNIALCWWQSKEMLYCSFTEHWRTAKQGKSEGFESCDRPIVHKRPILVKIGDVLYRVTLKFNGWPWKTIGHLSFAVSSFVQHFIAIDEFKLELQSGNAQFG